MVLCLSTSVCIRGVWYLQYIFFLMSQRREDCVKIAVRPSPTAVALFVRPPSTSREPTNPAARVWTFHASSSLFRFRNWKIQLTRLASSTCLRLSHDHKNQHCGFTATFAFFRTIPTTLTLSPRCRGHC